MTLSSNTLVVLENASLGSLWGLFPYESEIQRLLKLLKYRYNPRLGSSLGSLFCFDGRTIAFDTYDYIVPIPLHHKKLSYRGYNQVSVLFSSLLQYESYNDSLLIRHTATRPLYAFSPDKRKMILDNSFSLIPDISLLGKRVLVLDDIMTSGYTLSSVGKLLFKAGASHVDGLVFAYPTGCSK